MKLAKQSEITTGRTMLLKFKAMATVATSELLASIQDGGRCGDMLTTMYLMRKVRFWQLLEV
jgi:hypothetical protein